MKNVESECGLDSAYERCPPASGIRDRRFHRYQLLYEILIKSRYFTTLNEC